MLKKSNYVPRKRKSKPTRGQGGTIFKKKRNELFFLLWDGLRSGDSVFVVGFSLLGRPDGRDTEREVGDAEVRGPEESPELHQLDLRQQDGKKQVLFRIQFLSAVIGQRSRHGVLLLNRSGRLSINPLHKLVKNRPLVYWKLFFLECKQSNLTQRPIRAFILCFYRCPQPTNYLARCCSCSFFKDCPGRGTNLGSFGFRLISLSLAAY